MTTKQTYVLALSSVFALLSGCGEKQQELTVFSLLDSQHTGVDFKNTLTSSDSLNILDFEYMFNGGGVGVGDVNNDGLQDIYFTGNQVSNRLYLNLGGLKFKDITESSGTGSTGWSNGIAMADIDADGWLDMYVCRGGPRNTSNEDMANLVFMNNADGTFTKKGKEMGIADEGYSIQAVFFDYDKDGDNDLYVLTNALVPYNRNTSRPKLINGQAASTDRLFKNNGDGTFTNASQEAGIVIEGFGLGVSICDVNQDNWPDIYVSNDFLTNDILYINNQDGSFSDRIADYVKHQSYNGMGMNISDINNDGLGDIVVLDMLPQDNKRLKQTVGYFSYDKLMLDTDFGYMPQYVRNTLQLNNGNGSFSEIGQLSGIHSTDWSWSPLIADFDNDGWKDIFITNGYRRDVTNLDFIVFGQQSSSFGRPEAVRKDKLEKLRALPEVKLHNYMYKNQGNLTFSDESMAWGIHQPSYSNGAAYADFDNDGDLDLAINNIDDKAFMYQNNTIGTDTVTKKNNNFLQIKLSATHNPVGTSVYVYHHGQVQHQRYSPIEGYLSSLESRLHFGLGSTTMVDSLLVQWPNGKCQTLHDITSNQTLVIKAENGSICNKTRVSTPAPLFKETADNGLTYRHGKSKYVDFNKQTTLIKMNSRLGPGMAVGDINGDGTEDVYIGGGKGQEGSFFLQNTDGSFIQKKLLGGAGHEDMGTLLMDFDNDGDLDLLTVSGGGMENPNEIGYLDWIYLNDGSGNFERQELFSRSTSGSFVKAADFDKDGDLDLFIGGRFIDGSYPLSPKSYLLINENGSYTDQTRKRLNSDGNLGMLSDALFTDFDNDGWVDLIMVGEYMSPTFYKNHNGKFADVSNSTGLENESGWWNSIVSGDFDKDGDMDYVLGNLGLNSTYKASPREPITIYAKDFDGNGSIDPMMTCYRQGEEHLIHPRDVLGNQIVAMKRRFRTYEDYANAPFDRIFLKEELKDALVLKATTLNSVYVQNLGEGKFAMTELPLEAQYAPVFGMVAGDFNNDDHLDLLLTGNLFATEALTGAYDALTGLCLLGEGNGGFTPLKASESGLKIDGDAKGLVELQWAGNQSMVLASQNSGALKAYTYTSQKIGIPVGPMDAYALVHEKDGTVYKEELWYGSTYLSHSSRQLKVNPNLTEYVELVSYTDQIKKIDVSN